MWVRVPSALPVSFGDSLTVKLRVLAPSFLVRIQVSDPAFGDIMTHRIIKVPLKKERDQIVEVPADSRVVNVDFKSNTIYMWLIADISNELFKRTYEVFSTDVDMPEDEFRANKEKLSYIGSAVSNKEEWHVFEKVKSTI